MNFRLQIKSLLVFSSNLVSLLGPVFFINLLTIFFLLNLLNVICSRITLSVSFWFITLKLSEHNNLIYAPRVLPAAKDQKVGANGSRCVTVTSTWRTSHVLARFPGHGLSRPNLEVLGLIVLYQMSLLVAWFVSPTSKQQNFAATDIHRVAITTIWWRTTNAQSWPNQIVRIKDPYVVKVTLN